MIGRTLSHYKVLEEIGRGGMGVVYRALDTTLGREVALKVLSARPGESPSRSAGSSRRPARRRRSPHPAVSVVYEIDEAEGATFIAMELVRGRPLAALLAGTPLEPLAPSTSRSRWRKASPRPTPAVSCTATSSRRT